MIDRERITFKTSTRHVLEDQQGACLHANQEIERRIPRRSEFPHRISKRCQAPLEVGDAVLGLAGGFWRVVVGVAEDEAAEEF